MQGQPDSVKAWADDEPTLLDTVRILLNQWRLIVSITVAAAATSIIVALLIPPTFRAEIVVSEVQADHKLAAAGSLVSSLGGLANLAGVNLGGTPGSAPQARALLQSRFLIEEFIRRGNLLPVLFPEDSQIAFDEARSLWLGVKKFNEEILAIDEDRRTGLTTVSIRWHNPKTAANWANGFIALANEVLRKRSLSEGEQNIAYLQEQISKTNIVELQQVMYNLIERDMQTLMLANVRDEFAFSTIDPAVAPELRFRPHRTLIVVVGTALGAVLALLAVAFRRMIQFQVSRDANRNNRSIDSAN